MKIKTILSDTEIHHLINIIELRGPIHQNNLITAFMSASTTLAHKSIATQKRALRATRAYINEHCETFKVIIGQSDRGYFICKTMEDIKEHTGRLMSQSISLKNEAERDSKNFFLIQKQLNLF